MRSHDQIQEFTHNAQKAYLHKCDKCEGTDPDCRCYENYQIALSQYEACIPKDFWNIDPNKIKNNKKVFERVVRKYAERLNAALKHGYGLALLGSNGVGKTYFISYLLTEAIKKNRTAYYTTMPQLAYDIKAGFSDREAQKRLEWYLTSDFVAIDEMGKEKTHVKGDHKTFFDTEVERVMKNRCDDAQPVIIAANMDHGELMKAYGHTIGSMVMGKMKMASLTSGDFRVGLSKKMNDKMGY